MVFEEGSHPGPSLEQGLVEIQIQPVDPFNVQFHLLLKHFSHRLLYHCP
jgi:hypothetical protein